MSAKLHTELLMVIGAGPDLGEGGRSEKKQLSLFKKNL